METVDLFPHITSPKICISATSWDGATALDLLIPISVLKCRSSIDAVRIWLLYELDDHDALDELNLLIGGIKK